MVENQIVKVSAVVTCRVTVTNVVEELLIGHNNVIVMAMYLTNVIDVVDKVSDLDGKIALKKNLYIESLEKPLPLQPQNKMIPQELNKESEN